MTAPGPVPLELDDLDDDSTPATACAHCLSPCEDVDLVVAEGGDLVCLGCGVEWATELLVREVDTADSVRRSISDRWRALDVVDTAARRAKARIERDEEARR